MRLNRSLISIAVGLGITASAQAFWTPPASSPLYIKFSNDEQIAVSGNGITAPTGGYLLPTGISSAEQNWGILSVSSIQLGNTSINPYLYPAITGAGSNKMPSNIEITGIFYGIQQYTGAGCPTAICSSGGYIDLWGDDSNAVGFTTADIASATSGQRTGQNTFTNFTDGTFLGRLAFNWGIVSGNENIDIKGNQAASDILAGQQGQAESYADIIDVNGDGKIDASDGAWAALLNGDYFPVLGATGNVEYRDFRFNNNYNLNPAWSSGTDIVGAVSDDPARVYTTPEPGTIALLGLGFLGMVPLARRRKG